MSISDTPKKLFQVTILASSLCLMNFAGAGSVAGTGGSTEVTQIMNNIELAKNAVDNALTAKKTVDQYITQLQQYKIQILNAVGIDPAVLGKTMGDIQVTLGNLQAYKGKLDALSGSASAQIGVFDRRMTEARMAGMTFQQYLANARSEIQRNNELAKKRLEQEAAILKQVEEDHRAAQKYQSQVPEQLGLEQSVQQMNSQMNRLVVQNARILEMMAMQYGTDTQKKENNRLVTQERAMLEWESIVARDKAMRDAQNQMLGK